MRPRVNWEANPEEPLRPLAGAVVYQALLDLRAGSVPQRLEALTFLVTEGAELAVALGYNRAQWLELLGNEVRKIRDQGDDAAERTRGGACED